LIRTKNGHLDVALADFGIAQFCQEGEELYGNAGTPQYMAPEVLRRRSYSFPVDIWSAGLLLYEIILGQPLLEQESDFGISKQIDAIFSNPTEKKRKFSAIEDPQERDFLQHLLQQQSEKRPTARKALEHPYFNLIV
jgi:serine/threonine protein kinase